MIDKTVNNDILKSGYLIIVSVSQMGGELWIKNQMYL